MASNDSDRVAPGRTGAGSGPATTIRRPLIGLTSYLEPSRHGVWDVTSAILPEVYLRGVSAAGGRPLLLPPQPAWTAEEVADLDGVILTGGADVDPRCYDQPVDPATGTVYPQRDEHELALFAVAEEIGLPVLGICRGVQVINVARGGTLHQHLPDVVANSDHQRAPAVFTDVDVHLEPGSVPAGWYGETTVVRCHHHQAVDRLGTGLRVVGRAGDGTVEAVQDTDDGWFMIGLQWHPEEQLDQQAPFAALVAAARARYQHQTDRRQESA